MSASLLALSESDDALTQCALGFVFTAILKREHYHSEQVLGDDSAEPLRQAIAEIMQAYHSAHAQAHHAFVRLLAARYLKRPSGLLDKDRWSQPWQDSYATASSSTRWLLAHACEPTESVAALPLLSHMSEG